MKVGVSKLSKAHARSVGIAELAEKKYIDLKAQTEIWRDKAKQAVEKGRDDLAQKCLEKMDEYTESMESQKITMEESRNQAELLLKQKERSVKTISVSENRFQQLRNKLEAARGRKEIAELTDGTGFDTIQANLQQLSDDVNIMNSASRVLIEDRNALSEEQELESEVKQLGRSEKMESRIQELKEELSLEKKMESNIKLQNGEELCLSNMTVKEHDGSYSFEKPFINYVTKRLNLPYPIARLIRKIPSQCPEPIKIGKQIVVAELQAKLKQVLGQKVSSIIDVIDHEALFDRDVINFNIDLTIEEQHMLRMTKSIGQYVED